MQPSSALHVTARVLGICLLALGGACFSGGSGEVGAEPRTIATMTPEVLFLAPGESAEVQLRIDGDEGSRGFEVLEPDWPEVDPQPVPPDITVELSDENETTAALRASVGAAVAAGVHHYKVRFKNSANGATAVRIRDLVIVVVPTDATPTAGRVVGISTSATHSLALLDDGSIWAWGRNTFGQLGDGSLIDRQVPVQVQGLGSAAVAVAAGGRHSLAILADGTIWGWGDNGTEQVQWEGAFGDPDALYVTPVQLRDIGHNGGFFDDPVAVAAGKAHSVLLNAGGAVRAWGSNDSGQLGQPPGISNAIRPNVPLEVAAIAAGGEHTVVVGTDGSAWGWGQSDSGQLGAAVATPHQGQPIDIAFLPPVAGVGLGENHTLLILPDGSVRGLGRNHSSELGDGSLITPTGPPVQPPHLLNVQAIDGGWIHSLALEVNGSVFAWGSNDFGQASDSANMTVPSSLGQILQLVPQRVTTLPPCAAIAAGGRHSLAVASNCGSVLSFGDDYHGQLGTGTIRTTRARPEPVYGLGENLPGCRKQLGLFSRGAAGTITATTGQGTLVDAADCSAGCVASTPLGEVVTLTAVPAPGALFMGWSGNCSGSQPSIQVTMDRSRHCLARFAAPPVAQFSMDPDPAAPNTILVVADASASTDADGRIVSYEWDVGDDGTIDEVGVLPLLSVSPPVPIRLRVTDNDGLTGEVVKTLGVVGSGGGQVVADFYLHPLEPGVGQPVHFGAHASSSTNGPITLYLWDFEDDGTFDASGVMVEHVYNSAGTYTVRLRVTDSAGQTAEKTETFEVTPG